MELDKIVCMDALEYMRGLPDASVQLIVTDPPYYKYKDAAWDNQWPTPDAFIAWLATILSELQRVLAPNGSLYLFASPRMAARIEMAIEGYFNVLNRITWAKPTYSTKAEMFDKETMRAFFPSSEIVFFCEQRGSDGRYTTLEYELNGRVYLPLKEWFRERAKIFGITLHQLNRALNSATNGGGLASGYFGDKVEFLLPTQVRYEQMQAAFPTAFDREYKDLRKEYEDLRRPFNSSDRLPYTDVWTYRTVNSYPGKHECEKPPEMMRDIVTLSSRPGDTVLDCFCGSGASLKAARLLGRHYIGCDSSPHWADYARVNINSNRQIRYIEDKTLQNGDVQLSLFGD